jgi:hypothetical protein
MASASTQRGDGLPLPARARMTHVARRSRERAMPGERWLDDGETERAADARRSKNETMSADRAVDEQARWLMRCAFCTRHVFA